MTKRFSALNRQTAANWSAFSEHRTRVTDLILASCGAAVGRLAILGAGNCNDVDLRALLPVVGSLDLFDVDGEAVRRGVERQQFEGCDRIHIHAGVDVTGAAHCLEPWGSRSPSEKELATYLSRLGLVPALPRAGACDVVVSSCLLSALISTIVDALGPEHPKTLDLVTRVRDQHIRVLAMQLAAGGRALLISDLVSSDTCPALFDAADETLPTLMNDVLATRNFFTGTNPIAVAHRLHTLLAHGVQDVRALGPWRWRISNARAYLVYALAFTRSP